MSTYFDKKRMREQGMTYHQIADELGVSVGTVANALADGNPPYFRPFNKERCIYAGLRKWLNDNQVSIAELTRRIGYNPQPKIYQSFRKYLNGTNSPRKYIIDFILRVTGLTYEEAFRED